MKIDRIKEEVPTKLDELVHGFRNAIERAKNEGESSYYFSRFPVGQCGTTSDMLSQYLIDNGIENIEYVNGTYYSEDPENWQAHTWLLVDGLVIDITCDQFKFHAPPLRCDVPVYIGPVSDYYCQFKISRGGKHPHFGLQKEWSNYRELKSDYNTILRYLENDCP